MAGSYKFCTGCTVGGSSASWRISEVRVGKRRHLFRTFVSVNITVLFVPTDCFLSETLTCLFLVLLVMLYTVFTIETSRKIHYSEGFACESEMFPSAPLRERHLRLADTNPKPKTNNGRPALSRSPTGWQRSDLLQASVAVFSPHPVPLLRGEGTLRSGCITEH